ncbi:unnamed protein product [Durusdinium trenchii]|uniref:Uncharacterized protein n=1 Tax=Durusdinium trenchii TaxID=1381693 RepID=A0ABP0SUS6_9DINO
MRQMEVLSRAHVEEEAAKAYSIGKQEASAVFQLINRVPSPVVSELIKVMLLIQRMCADWDKMHPTLRKAWNARDTANLHAVCGGFLHYVGLLEKKIAKHDFDTTIAGIQEQFMSGHLDIDISHAMESSPFPGQLEDVGFLRSWFGSVVEGMFFQIMVSQTSNFVFSTHGRQVFFQ